MNMLEINEEIERLENSETDYNNCSKLAILYVIKDHIEKPEPRIVEYSNPSSEFIEVVSGAPIESVLRIIDEHMECIKLLYPKEYSTIISKIKAI